MANLKTYTQTLNCEPFTDPMENNFPHGIMRRAHQYAREHSGYAKYVKKYGDDKLHVEIDIDDDDIDRIEESICEQFDKWCNDVCGVADQQGETLADDRYLGEWYDDIWREVFNDLDPDYVEAVTGYDDEEEEE